jgi:hypothetical protein
VTAVGEEISAMVYNSQDTARAAGGLAHAITKFFESIGLLNKGSADASAVPNTTEAAQVQPIVSNSLNVTRVGGLAALITSVGAVALAVFNVNKKSDPVPVVVAAYISVGVIVVAALLTAAIIISADVRARTSVAVAHSPESPAPAKPPPEAVAARPVNGASTLVSQTAAVTARPSGNQVRSGPDAAEPAPSASPQQSWALYDITSWDWPTARMLTATLDLWKVPYDHHDKQLAVQALFAPLIDNLVTNFGLPAPARLP